MPGYTRIRKQAQIVDERKTRFDLAALRSLEVRVILGCHTTEDGPGIEAR
jgi:hypothetical protein